MSNTSLAGNGTAAAIAPCKEVLGRISLDDIGNELSPDLMVTVNRHWNARDGLELGGHSGDLRDFELGKDERSVFRLKSLLGSISISD